MQLVYFTLGQTIPKTSIEMNTTMTKYTDINFKIPKELEDYQGCSEFVINAIESIVKKAMDKGQNRIEINTNLKLGIPMENVNKIAGPFIEAWAHEVFSDVLEDTSDVKLFKG
jgi:hypothetical protein